MKKEVGTKTVVIVLAVAVLAVLWFGWKMAFGPKPGGELPPASTQPKPFSSGATAGRGTGGPAAPDPANLENDMRQRRPAR